MQLSFDIKDYSLKETYVQTKRIVRRKPKVMKDESDLSDSLMVVLFPELYPEEHIKRFFEAESFVWLPEDVEYIQTRMLENVDYFIKDRKCGIKTLDESLAWALLYDDNCDDDGFSFYSVCKSFNINPETIRMKFVSTIHSEVSELKQLRKVGKATKRDNDKLEYFELVLNKLGDKIEVWLTPLSDIESQFLSY